MLRRGRTKNILESSIDCALLAVEIYNKPRTQFRVETYITHMIMAWTRLFHAHFYHTLGDKYYYKEKNGRYKKVDGERKTWELKTCISKYGNFDEAMRKNLEFFIKLRNKIEHRHIDKDEIGIMIFGECQACLYNYENILIHLFGEEYAINESLAFSLQFSCLRTKNQKEMGKKLLSKEVKELKKFIEDYRRSLSDEIFNKQEYSIKLIQIPKVSNTNKNDLAIEFVKWDEVSDEDKKNYEKIVTIIKDKIVKKEVVNPGKLKPGEVVNKVNENISININHYDHLCLYTIFNIRPHGENKEKAPFNTNTNYCHYDEVHDDYVYQEKWVDFITQLIELNKLKKEEWRDIFRNNNELKIEKYLE